MISAFDRAGLHLVNNRKKWGERGNLVLATPIDAQDSAQTGVLCYESRGGTLILKGEGGQPWMEFFRLGELLFYGLRPLNHPQPLTVYTEPCDLQARSHHIHLRNVYIPQRFIQWPAVTALRDPVEIRRTAGQPALQFSYVTTCPDRLTCVPDPWMIAKVLAAFQFGIEYLSGEILPNQHAMLRSAATADLPHIASIEWPESAR